MIGLHDSEMTMAALLFDFDGVLADTLDEMLNFARAACEQLNLPCNPTPADLDALETMSFAEYGRQLKVPPKHIDEFVNLCLEMFNLRPHPPKMFDGMDRVLVEAAGRNQVGIITGNTSETVEKFLKENDLQEYIKLVIGVEQPGSKPEKIERALKALVQSRNEAYMIGDAISDIRAAKQVSIKSIAVGWGHQSVSKLEGADPDYLVRSPQELRRLLRII